MKDDKDVGVGFLIGVISGIILSLAIYGAASLIANLL